MAERTKKQRETSQRNIEKAYAVRWLAIPVKQDCAIDECDSQIERGGPYCQLHRGRMRIFGSPTPIRMCEECNKEFVLVDPQYILYGVKRRRMICRDCVAIIQQYEMYLPQHEQKVTMHGVSLVQYLLLLKSQNFACALCNIEFQGVQGRFIDHDHSCCPGRYGCKRCVRGIVCPGCNTLIGFLETKGNAIKKFDSDYKERRNIFDGLT